MTEKGEALKKLLRHHVSGAIARGEATAIEGKPLETKLIWNEVAPDEWQAGSLEKSYSVVKTVYGHFSLRYREGDAPSRFLRQFKTLSSAKRYAKAHDFCGNGRA